MGQQCRDNGRLRYSYQPADGEIKLYQVHNGATFGKAIFLHDTRHYLDPDETHHIFELTYVRIK